MPMPARRLCWPLLLVALFVADASAGQIQAQLRQMLQAHDLRDTRTSVMVRDLDTGEVLAQLDADEPMIPASNMKLMTTAAALDVLGPQFMFRTELGMIEADDSDHAGAGPALIVRGDGDPAFGDPVLLEELRPELAVEDVLDFWLQAAAATGVKQFDRLIVDDRVFNRQFVHPTWPEGQLNRSYCAQVAGLNFYRNCIDVSFVPADRRGQAPEAIVFPDAPFIRTTNKAITGGKDAYWISRAATANKFTFHGTVRNRPLEPTQVTVHDPAVFFGKLLAHRLERDKHIQIGRVERPADDAMLPPAKPLHRMTTALPEVLRRVNRDSQNMFAEALIKRMGRKVTGAAGSWENGAAAVRISLRRRLGPSSAAINIADGSGLSRENRVTAKSIVNLLASLHNDSNRRKAQLYRRSLAVSGKSGTLEDRLEKLDATVYGKSGYLRAVSALSGYLVIGEGTESQRTLAFSLLFNGFKPPLYNPQMKQLQNQMVQAVAEAAAPDKQLGG